MAGFVFHALRPDHPLIDLHLFSARWRLGLTMSLFAIAFFGACSCCPTT